MSLPQDGRRAGQVAAEAHDSYVLALDVGGTTMKAALTGPDNVPRFETRRPTGSGVGPDGAVAAILDLAGELRAIGEERFGGPPAAAGVALPGIVDEAAGVAVYSANLGWRDVPFRRLLSERLGGGIPVAVGHDLRVAALAEGRLGAGVGVDRFLLVALGTGIAAALSIDGRTEPGAHGRAGELGHVVVRPGGPPCSCGQRGCLEVVASAAAVGRAWAAAAGAPGLDAADAARAVAAGDPRAAVVWERAVDALADGLLAAISLLDPRTLIVGGGLAEAGETLLTPLRAALAARAVVLHQLPEIVPAGLGDAAGCLGAGLLAWDRALAVVPS
ncbi:ROK family protein [Streptomyces sp. DSM 44918]|uniref:ROK family protein n=2 Tax=Streptomyces millisiae TaxID=3075542 RepID=A0ABU2LZE1_9ACTN|nr:ROK family protein [Streptomyces sp. DSM 44918]MDT0322910.1 ROK family protein [Streptomyces sp. DSM 44918]